MAPGVPAIRRLNHQSGVVSVVTLVASRHQTRRSNLVRIGQGEARIGMVERRIRPQDRVVALAAE